MNEQRQLNYRRLSDIVYFDSSEVYATGDYD